MTSSVMTPFVREPDFAYWQHPTFGIYYRTRGLASWAWYGSWRSCPRDSVTGSDPLPTPAPESGWRPSWAVMGRSR